MKGWRYEGYRHSLAARGISTRLSLASPPDFPEFGGRREKKFDAVEEEESVPIDFTKHLSGSERDEFNRLPRFKKEEVIGEGIVDAFLESPKEKVWIYPPSEYELKEEERKIELDEAKAVKEKEKDWPVVGLPKFTSSGMPENTDVEGEDYFKLSSRSLVMPTKGFAKGMVQEGRINLPKESMAEFEFHKLGVDPWYDKNVLEALRTQKRRGADE